MKKILLCMTIMVIVCPSLILNAYEYGDPTAAEQAHLEYINWARAKPFDVATFYGLSSLFEGVPDGEISGNPVPPLTLNKQLSEAAYNHSKDMTINSFFSHYSQDGRSPFDRMKNTGYQYSSAGENIAMIASSESLEEVDSSLALHKNLFVDKDYPDRGHRVNILSPNFKEIGIGLYGGPSQSYPYAYLVTTDFASSFTDNRYFVLGVIYEDKDQNGYYSAGEGIGGVSIVEETTGETATSATAGGYAIPFSSGNYTFMFIHPSGSTVSKTVSVTENNIKVDISLSDFKVNTSPLLSKTQVSQLYVSIFGRASEGEGNAYWSANQNDMTVAANTMLDTDPAKTYFGSTLNDNQAFIEFIYLNTLGKTYTEDPIGINYWVNQLFAGKSKGEVIATMISAATDPQYAGSAAQNQFNNKVAVCSYTAGKITTVPDVNNLTAFVNFIKDVTHDSSTVTAAKAAVDEF
jgi:Cysteine-rich secretory protein family/Domain of unknown function (DUF4214)